MAKINLTIPNLESAIKKIGKFRLEKIAEIVSELDRTALMVESGAKRNLTDNGQVNLGGLRSSVVRQEYGKFNRTVGTKLEYAMAIEFGRKPGSMPPLAPIKEWMKKKGIPEGALWPIAMKIKREGSPARPFLFPAAEAERQNFINNLKRILSTTRKTRRKPLEQLILPGFTRR
jgi:phage gpG-like protein